VSRRGGGYNPGMDADRAAFLAAIIARPDDDLPRRIFADWLDEHPGGPCLFCKGQGVHRGGHLHCDSRGVHDHRYEEKCLACDGTGRDLYSAANAERAEFIRVQCAAERLIDATADVEVGGSCSDADVTAQLIDLDAQVAALRPRERELLAAHGDDWAAADLGPGLAWQAVAAPRWSFGGHSACHFRRGFVDWVGCSWRTWRAHASALRQAAPITRVQLTTPAPTLAVLERAYPGIAFDLPPAAEFPTDPAALERVAAIPPAG
jgi:uncharacterized protein (TIGR02996 family)